MESFEITYAQGRELTPDDAGSVVIGSDLVDRLGFDPVEADRSASRCIEPSSPIFGAMKPSIT